MNLKFMRTIVFAVIALTLMTMTGLAQTEITVFVTHDYVAETLAEIAVDFEAANPDLKVSVNLQADYWDKVTTMFAAGTPPDILWMGDGQVATYAGLGYLADVDELMERINASLELVPISVELASVDGQLMFMPFDWGAWSLAYNTRLFDESGLAHPTDTWTWSDFARAAQQTTRFSGEHATVQGTMSMSWGWWGSWLQLVWQAGGDLVSEDGLQAFPNFNALIDAFEFAHALTYEYNATPDVPEASLTDATRAMQWMLPPEIFGLRDIMSPDEWGIATLPKGDGEQGRHAAQAYATGLSITSQSPNKEGAARFLAYVHEPENQMRLFEGGNLMPTSPTLLTDWFFRPDTLAEHNMPDSLPALFDIVDKHSRALPKITRFEDFTTRVSNVFANMMDDEISPRNAAENARVEAQATLQ